MLFAIFSGESNFSLPFVKSIVTEVGKEDTDFESNAAQAFKLLSDRAMLIWSVTKNTILPT
jgi:hypothetical protein